MELSFGKRLRTFLRPLLHHAESHASTLFQLAQDAACAEKPQL
jgi:hypothetical protein